MLQDFSRKCMQNADKTFAPLSYGRTLFVGDSVRQREELTARAFDVCIIVEGDRLQHELQAFLFSICIRQFSCVKANITVSLIGPFFLESYSGHCLYENRTIIPVLQLRPSAAKVFQEGPFQTAGAKYVLLIQPTMPKP